jgi:hypothetical protein
MSEALETRGRLRRTWTAGLIKRLRGKRSQTEFGVLVGARANTIWRWEDGRTRPDDTHSHRLDQLARQEHFLADWRLAGSITLRGDVEAALWKLSRQTEQTLSKRSLALRE